MPRTHFFKSSLNIEQFLFSIIQQVGLDDKCDLLHNICIFFLDFLMRTAKSLTGFALALKGSM